MLLCLLGSPGSGRGAESLREEPPRSTDQALEAIDLDAIETMLQRARMQDEDDASDPENARSIERAATRLLEMRTAGAIPADAPLLLEALRKLAFLRAAQGRFLEAREALETLEATTGRDAAWKSTYEFAWRTAGRPPGGLLTQGGPSDPETPRMSPEEGEDGGLFRSGPATFVRSRSLEVRLSTLRSGMAARDPQGLSAFLEESTRSDALIEGGDGLLKSLWVVLDRAISRTTPPLTAGDLARIRAAQEKSAGLSRRGPATAARPEELFRLYRRLPWAAGVHRALQERGEAALRQGRTGIASRCFDDVLHHATDEGLLARARVGCWLALCQEAPEKLASGAAFVDIDLAATVSFLGEETPISRVRDRLIRATSFAGETSRGSPPLAQRELEILRIPPVMPWGFRPRSARREHRLEIPPAPLGRLQRAGHRVLLAAPHLLACFDSGTRELLWSRTPQPPPGADGDEEARPDLDRRHSVIPGSFRPAIAGGRVYTRWDPVPPGRYLSSLAAFDLEGGEMVWSTRGDEAWGSTLPISDPAAGDGRLFVMVTREGPVYASPVILVCLEARTGRKLWERLLGSRPLALPRAGLRDLPQEVLDVVRWGNAVTVREGAVYCSTNLGIVARCDARDGLVEWIRTYPRFRLGRSPGIVTRRQGISPVVHGDTVVFAPRDIQGSFALDARTGDLLWDRPFLPSVEQAGTIDGRLLLRDEHAVVAVEIPSGKLLWKEEFPRGGVLRGIIENGTCLVGDPEKVVRLAGESGEVLEEIRWDRGSSRRASSPGPGSPDDAGSGPAGAADPPRDFVPLEGRLLLLTDGSVDTAETNATLETLRSGDPLGLPLRPAAAIPGAGRLTWSPADIGHPGGDAYLFSDELLTCLQTTPRPRVRWRRFVPAGIRKLRRVGSSLLLLYPRRLLALDPRTGTPRWDTQLRIESEVVLPLKGGLFVGSVEDRRSGAFVDAGTGRIIWQRQLGSGENGAVVGSDRDLHLIVDGVLPDGRRTRDLTDFTLDVKTGKIRSSRTVSPVDDGRSLVPSAAVRSCFFTYRGALYEYHPVTGRKILHQVDFDRQRVRSLDLEDGWLLIRSRGERESGSPEEVLLRRSGISSRLLRRDGNSILREGRLYELVDGTLRETRLSTGEDRTFTFSVGASDSELLHAEERDGSLWVITVLDAGRAEERRLQVDVFDTGDGQHLGGERLEGVIPRHRNEDDEDSASAHRYLNRVWLGGGVLWVTDGSACRIFGPADPQDVRQTTAHPAWLASASMAVDGFPDDWEKGCVLSVPAPGAREGELHLAHDTQKLYIGLRYRNPYPTPVGGSLRTGSGDRLELEVATAEGPLEVLAGFDERWQTIVRSRRWDEPGRTVEVAVSGGDATGLLTYEVAIPLRGIAALQPAESRLLALTLALQNDGPGGTGPERTVVLRKTTGEPLPPGRRIPDVAGSNIYLVPLTHHGGAALQALTAGAPGLETSFRLFARECRARAVSPGDFVRRQESFIRDHPESITVERLLAFDRPLREWSGEDPSPRLLRAGREAGVSPRVLSRYERQAGGYVSQWARVTGRGYPRSIVIELHDGSGPGGWEHRVNLVKHYRSWPERPPQLHDRILQDDWHELRIPLVYLGMNDTPICGASWTQQGPPGIAWDRTAVVFDGRETVFLDDAAGEDTAGDGRTSSGWKWISSPVKSGRRAHQGPVPTSRYEVESHSVRSLKPPVTAHITLPREEPSLSQWVFIDPEKPPRMLSLRLHDGRAWRDFLLWGEKLYAGRYLGPLPEAGVWTELRVPLSWTRVGSRPLVGISFGQRGGRVLWDRTALVTPAGEQVWIDDDLPAGALAGPGPGARPSGFGAAFCGDGVRTRVDVPHREALEPQQGTVEAWVYLEEYPGGRDKRRWLVAKNGDELTDGHYALMLRWGQVGASLNAGGGRENRFEAWSRPGAVGLHVWHHVAMTFDSEDLEVYLDGLAVARQTVGRARTRGSGSVTIGARPDGYVHFEGFIDEVSIHDRALTAGEVKALRDRGVVALREGAPSLPSPSTAVLHESFDRHGVPPETGTRWEWTAASAKSGRRARVQECNEAYTTHCALFPDSPMLAHLRVDREHAASLVRAHLPALGPTGDARSFLEEILALHPTDAGVRVRMCRAFLEGIPEHPGAVDVLDALLDAHGGGEKALRSVEAFLAETGLPSRTVYTWRRRHDPGPRPWVTSWSVLGPMAPESVPRQVASRLAGADPGARLHPEGWKPAEVGDGQVQIPGFPGPSERLVAFALAKVEVPSVCRALLEVERSDCDIEVVLRGRRVLDSTSRASWGLTGLGAPIQLAAGVNEILVEISAGGTGASFTLEIVDPSGRGAPEGLHALSPTDSDGG